LLARPVATTPFFAPILYVGLVLLAAIWLSTFGLQVPLHRRLELGFDDDAHAALVRTNWIRTLAWTARGLLLLVLVALHSTPAAP
jgi:hypothetical protein